MKFNKLNVPESWQHYWSRYPEGYTILEALLSWVKQVDDMVDNQNKLNTNVEQFRNEIDDFVGRFDERLQDEVKTTLKDWQSSGFLDVVISEALQWELDNYIATNEQDKLLYNEQLAQMELKAWVSVTDYGADPTGITDSTQAIQQAVNEGKTIYFPVGTYIISDTIREGSNGGARQLIGENQYNTVIRAGETLFDKPMVWFGNSTGHGNYRGLISNMSFDGVDLTKRVIGIRWHEAGTSTTKDVRVMNCDIAIQALGCIHKIFDGNTFIQNCNDGILLKRIITGTPSSNDDITKTASPLALNTNASKIYHVWFNGIFRNAIVAQGGMVLIDGCTFQGASKGGALYDVISIESSNEAKDYGGGPIIKNNWFEGGDYRYAIAVRNTRAVRIKDNFISGSDSQSSSMEGAILLDNSPSSIVIGNSIRGGFLKTPSQGRLSNGGIYVTQNSLSAGLDISSNYLTKTAGAIYYYENTPNPTNAKPRRFHWAVIKVVEGVADILDASDNFIASVSKQGTGLYTCVYVSNRESALGDYPTLIASKSINSSTPITSTIYEQSAQYDRISFTDKTGAFIDPQTFTIAVASELRTF